MKTQVEVKLNLPHSNKMTFDVDILRGKHSYKARVEMYVQDEKSQYITGEGPNIDEAVEALLQKMDFYNEGWRK